MQRTILIASGKGGVGKSTVTARLGTVLSDSGVKTLLIDCDAGLSSLYIMLDAPGSGAFSWYDVYTEKCTVEEAVIHIENGPDLITAPSFIPEEPAEDAIKNIVDALKEKYEVILIDSPAGISLGMKRGAKAVKQAIVIATADEISVKGAAALERTVRQCGISQTRLLINRYELKAVKKGKLLDIDSIIDKTNVQLLGIIPEDKEIVYSSVTGKFSKKSKSYKAVSRIAGRVSGKNIPLSLSLLK